MTKKFTLRTITLALSLILLAPFTNSVLAATEPEIVSEAAIVMDYETGEIVYEKNANEQMYLASTSKIMTSLLFAENASKKDSIPYTEEALAQPPYTMNSEQMGPAGKSFSVGDTLSGDTCMKELLLFSGNDTAYMIADYVGGTSEKFVQMMNDKAAELGCTNTHFENPNGLPVNGTDVNYSTAYELGLITKVAFENDWIRETMQTANARVTLPQDTIIDLENRNTELNKNGNIGGKTGVTDAAGTCFAGVYERDGKKYIAVVLKCDRNDNSQRFVDLDSMLDYSEKAEREIYKKSGTKVGTAKLSYKLFRFFGPEKTIEVPITLSEDAMLYDTDTNNSEAKISYTNSTKSAWDVASNNKVKATLSVRNYSSEIKATADITTGKIIKANLGLYITILAVIIIIIILIVIIIKLIRSAGSSRKRNIYGKRRRR